MRYGKGLHLQILDKERFVFSYFMEDSFRNLSQRSGADHSVHGSAGGINRNPVSPCDHSQSFDMIGVLMGDQYPVNISSCKLQTVQTGFHLFSADADIHQNMGAF